MTYASLGDTSGVFLLPPFRITALASAELNVFFYSPELGDSACFLLCGKLDMSGDQEQTVPA